MSWATFFLASNQKTLTQTLLAFSEQPSHDALVFSAGGVEHTPRPNTEGVQGQGVCITAKYTQDMLLR